MRFRWITAIGATSILIGAGVAGASHVTPLDPATVPLGFLSAHIRIANLPVAELDRAARLHGWDTFMQHLRLAPDEATIWHSHPGPSIVNVVKGTLIYEEEVGGVCKRTTYNAGTGFVDRGFGYVHRAIGGAHGPDFYATFITPVGTVSQTKPETAPPACA